MKDIEYLMSMYPSGVKLLQRYVSEACDRMEYKNSPIFDEFPDQVQVNRMCDSICRSILAEEGTAQIQSLWNIKEEDRSSLEMQALSKEMERLGARESGPSWDAAGGGFPSGRVGSLAGMEMEAQEVRWVNPWMPIPKRPPQGSAPGRPPMTPPPGTGPSRPPFNPPPVPGPGRPPMTPPPAPGPVRPPMTPPQGPGPARPPFNRPQNPGPARPAPKPSSWLSDMVRVLLLNEMFHRRCRYGICSQ